MVDRGVGLDRVRDREVVRRLDLPVQRADDPAGHGFLETERRSDRDRSVADRDVVGVAEAERDEQRARRVDVNHGEIGRRIGADDRRLVSRAVPELHRDRRRTVDDVLVRDDVSLRVVDEPRALRALGVRAAERRRALVTVSSTTPLYARR